jgi:flagellin-like protein
MHKKRPKNQRGLSAVITTLLVILFAIVAVGILWIVVNNLITKDVETVGTKWKFFNEKVEINDVGIDPGNDLLLTVQVRRSSGTLIVKTSGEEGEEAVEVDLISITDLSGSMSRCIGVNANCDSDSECNSVLGTPNISYSQGSCNGVRSDKFPLCESVCGGTLVDKLTPTKEANIGLVSTILVEPEESDSRIGLVGYNGSIKNFMGLTGKGGVSDLTDEINSWEAGGFTCICCGINRAEQELQNSPAETPKVMIVMSDGQAGVECAEQGVTPDLNGNGDSDDDGDDAVQAACDANASLEQLTIHSVGAGADVDEATLQAIADCGNGDYFAVEDVSDLITTYEAISGGIIKTHTSKTELSFIRIYFYNATSFSVTKDISVPEALKTEADTFDLTGEITGPITKVEIYPIIVSSGKEVIGPMSDAWEF